MGELKEVRDMTGERFQSYSCDLKPNQRQSSYQASGSSTVAFIQKSSFHDFRSLENHM